MAKCEYEINSHNGALPGYRLAIKDLRIFNRAFALKDFYKFTGLVLPPDCPDLVYMKRFLDESELPSRFYGY